MLDVTIPKSAVALDHLNLMIGLRLIDARRAAKLSSEEVAAHIGISREQHQDHESGVESLSAARLYQYAKLFKTPVSYFFDISDLNDWSEAN